MFRNQSKKDAIDSIISMRDDANLASMIFASDPRDCIDDIEVISNASIKAAIHFYPGIASETSAR